MSDKVTLVSKQETERKIAFVISPIGKPDSPERRRSNQILRYIIKPVVTELGYEAIRADDITSPGIITTQIIDHIIKDPLVIADLTDHNPNVMYELSLRHAIRKPVVQLICENQPLPFDVSGNRTIKLDHKDLDSVEQAKADLKKFIIEVIKDPSLVDSPISQAVTLDSLKQGGNPVGTALFNLSQMVGEVANRLSAIERKMVIEERSERAHNENLRQEVARLQYLKHLRTVEPREYEPPEEEPPDYEPQEQEPQEEEPQEQEPQEQEPQEQEPQEQEPQEQEPQEQEPDSQGK
jgi:flagellar biosynthesis GTPase FlhF